MTTMASLITSLTVLYSTVFSGADQRKHQSSASLAFVWGIHRDRWIPHTKGQLRGKCIHLMTSSWFVNKWSSGLMPLYSFTMDAKKPSAVRWQSYKPIEPRTKKGMRYMGMWSGTFTTKQDLFCALHMGISVSYVSMNNDLHRLYHTGYKKFAIHQMIF